VSPLRDELRDSGYPAEAGQDLVLEVRDDGRGISLEETNGAKSLGLLGMRERARLHGGKLAIQGSPGKGTQVRVSVPVGPPE
jgi:signal transduction histidine kinase